MKMLIKSNTIMIVKRIRQLVQKMAIQNTLVNIVDIHINILQNMLSVIFTNIYRMVMVHIISIARDVDIKLQIKSVLK